MGDLPDLSEGERELIGCILDDNHQTVGSVVEKIRRKTPGFSFSELPFSYCHAAAYYGRVEIFKVLFAADTQGNKAIARELVNKQVDYALGNAPDPRDKDVTFLALAAAEGHAEMVKYLLSIDAVPSITNGEGLTPPQLAARGGHLEAFKMFGIKGKDLNVQVLASQRSVHYPGATYVSLAAQHGRREMVIYLVSKGADTGIVTTQTGLDPAALAIMRGDLRIFHALGVTRQTINKKVGYPPSVATGESSASRSEKSQRIAGTPRLTCEGASYLMLAIMHKREEAVRYLLRNKADKKQANQFGLTAIHIAAYCGNVTIFEILDVTKGEVDEPIAHSDAPGHSGATCLMLAAANRATEMVRYLIGVRNADTTKVNVQGFTAAQLAVLEDMHEVLPELGISKENVNERTSNAVTRVFCDGATYLCLAALGNAVHSIGYLLGKGADKALTGAAGFTPMEIAAHQGNWEALIALGLTADNINTRSEHTSPWYKDITYLGLAALKGHTKLVTRLLDMGADKAFTNHNGYTPALLAALSGHIDVLRELGVCSENVNEVFDVEDGDDKMRKMHYLSIAAIFNQADTVAWLIDNLGARKDVRSESGLTPIHSAACYNRKEVLQSMRLSAGEVDIRTQNRTEAFNNLTPLAIASANGCDDAVQYLLDKGADPECRNGEGLTAAQLAVLHWKIKTAMKIIMVDGTDSVQQLPRMMWGNGSSSSYR